MHKISAFLLFFFFYQNLWANSENILPFRAVYEIKVRGISAGEMEMKALFDKNSYQIKAKTNPSITAKIVGYGKISENAAGNIINGNLKPKIYQREMEGDENYSLKYVYDLNNKQIKIESAKLKQTLQFENNIPFDILSLILQTLHDESKQKISPSYSLLSDEKIRTYQVEKLADEKWRNNKQIINIKVYQQSSGNRRTLIYLAEQPLRLVKLMQIKNDETRFVLNLLDYQTLP